ncbi:MAG: glycoside hydrolase family 3 N-terminal domain-containing protein [Caldilineaceae bacterium]
MRAMNRSELYSSKPNDITQRRRLFSFAMAAALLFACLLTGLGHNRAAAQETDPAATGTPAPGPVQSPSQIPLQDPPQADDATPTVRVTRSITETLRFITTATAQAAQTMTAQATPADSPTATATPSPTPVPGPDDLLTQEIDRFISAMSVADRIGQLFVIDFQGNQVGTNSDIAELIQEYRIGGVVIGPENRNFTNTGSEVTPVQVAILANQLQALTYGVYLRSDQALNPPPALLAAPDTLNLGIFQRVSQRVPLLIGVEQMGDDLTHTSLRQGFTSLPSQMALGATWNPQMVESIGTIVGQELSAVGVNLLLGPGLDVLEQPRADLGAGLGVESFGGDPYWVGKLGRAYISGIHQGSNQRIATMASHFPGQGGTDRRPDEEVATIQKSLDELRRTDLLPFAGVTSGPSALLRSTGDPSVTEGLISGHIRYSSFQGNRERTPPISLATELSTILALEEFANWRSQGGLVMSDALGLPAVRRYYDPKLERFQRKQIALDAFLAGNDLLYLSRFSLTDQWEDARNNIKETVLFFRDLYTRDPSFAARVDNSVRRILRLKFRLYGSVQSKESLTSAAKVTIPLTDVLVRPEGLRVLSGSSRDASQALVGQVAQKSLSILYPDPQGLSDTLPLVPQPNDRILIFSDSRALAECVGCPSVRMTQPDALEKIIVGLYGPDATGQLSPDYVTSYSFEELSAFLRDAAPTVLAQAMDSAIEEADWLIFAMADVDVARFEYSDAVKQFLRLRSDQVNGRIVVLALSAPYYLDSTEISKLSAYLGVYSKNQSFLEAAVRALFRAAPATGAPPVSAPGTRFGNLIERLEPDPEQRIELRIVNKEVIDSRSGAEVSVQVAVTIGDILEIEAGPILDHNGNPAPDGTNVSFRLIYSDADLALPAEPVVTKDGIARIAVPLERAGTLNITASSVNAHLSTRISVSIQTGQNLAQINISNPPTEVLPTETPVATPVPEPTAAIVLEPIAPPRPKARVTLLTLAIAAITQLVFLALFLVVLVRVMPRSMLVYRLLWATLTGWAVYILYGTGLIPGGTWLQLNLYPWGAAAVVFIGMLVPMVWLQLKTE